MKQENKINIYFREVYNAVSDFCSYDESHSIIPQSEAFDLWLSITDAVKMNGGKIFFCGNGASCTMAEHMSHDCFQNMDIDTYTVSETSHITAISNDISYAEVFSYRISKIGKPTDMLIAISSSGNSRNIINAVNAAKEKRMFVVTITGMSDSNQLIYMGNLNFHVPLSTYGMVESAHAILLHSWLDLYMDTYMEGRH